MSPRAEIIYLLSRINAQQERTIEILLGLQSEIKNMPRRSPWWERLTTADVWKLAAAGVLLWLTITGRATPHDVLQFLK